MATDFFQRQEIARRNTARLVLLFLLAVVAIAASVALLFGLVAGLLAGEAAGPAVVVEPGLIALAFAATLLVVGGGSLFKVAQLRGGGRVVAEELGGRLLHHDTAVPAERQLLNVVEEMAIASGTPVPPVYLLDAEEGINAFAAGFTPADAVIGVTRGSAERLTRDELQGVMAHEFSHIFNGDMRLNIRLIGVLHGILIIGMLGYFILRSAAFQRGRSRRQGNPLPLLALGAGLAVAGFFGTLFGNLIKAAVSRQREFLADASAVQFTRHPPGIAGALKKIGAVSAGSAIQNPNAPEASHMFFGRATSGLSALFSTHPPLRERIRRVEPSWDGTFPAVPAAPPPGAAPQAASAGLAGLAGNEAAGAAGPGAAPAAAAVASVGQPGEAHIRYARRLIDSLPAPLVGAAHEPYGGRALVYALLLDREAEPRRQQIAHLSAAADPGVYEETLRLAPLVEALDERARLPLLDMALPALRALTPAQYAIFRRNVAALVQADETIDLFEWALQRILLHDLEAHHGRATPPAVRHRSLSPLRAECEVLLSRLAYAGHRDEASARRAFEEARQALRLPDLRLRPAAACGLDALDAALGRLEEAAPGVKRQVLEAAVACIMADRRVSAAEGELLRAVSASLGCPMPPLLAA